MNKIFNNDKFKSYVIVHCAKTITYFNTSYIFYLLLIWYVLWRPKRSWDLQKESRWRYAIERHTIHQIDQSTNTHTSSRSSVEYLSPSPRSATVYLCIISHFVFVYGTHLIILGQLVVRHREEPGGPLQRVGAARLEVEGAQAPVLQLTHEVLARGSMIFAHQLF